MENIPYFTNNSKIAVCETKNMGFGVFAMDTIFPNELIEIAPMLLVPKEIGDLLCTNSGLGDYLFEWEDDGFAIATGFGSFYNHSYSPNSFYRLNYMNKTIEFVAFVKIKEGEEITVNYNGQPDNLSPLWFNVQE